MITLKLKNYPTEEVKEIRNLLRDVQKHIEYQCEKYNDCKTCPIKHICEDVDNALSYTRKTYRDRLQSESEG